jgi:hypothetical protein
MSKVEGSIMQSLTRDVESQLIETPVLSTPAAFLDGIVTLNIVQ